MEQRTAEWHEARKGRITASEVGAILGRSSNATRADVMRRKVREWHGAEPEFAGNIATKYGQNNEDGAIVEYTMETGNKVQPVGFVTKEDWAGCSPDGLIGEYDGLEIKCPFGLRDQNPPQFKTLEEQPHYFDQVQFSLWVTNRAIWHFFQWAKFGTKLEYVGASDEWQAENLPKLRQFYAEYLAERDNPELVAMHLAPKRQTIDTPQAVLVMSEYDQICEAIENAEARKKELIAQMEQMTGGKSAIIAGRSFTKVEKAGSISYAKAIKELMPDANLEKWRGNPSSYWLIK